VPPQFEPAAHPALLDLGARLRDLAGDAAFQAGRDYLRKGLVGQGTVAGTTAYATVRGSTEYRVSIAFPSAAALAVRCTCPAHRRNRFCKHVVALWGALLERPAEFTASDAPPEPAAAGGKRRGAERASAAPKPDAAVLRAAGLGTLDRLLDELAEGGLLGLGPDKAALLAGAGELVRSLKLRRLGNLLLRLQRAVAAERGDGLDAVAFARLLQDLWLTREATAAHLEGRIALDPLLAEELLGKTWREEELEPVANLELVELAYTRADDGDFRIETSYLADLNSGEILLERQIAPRRLATGSPKARHRLRLLVDAAALYPGLAPRRVKLIRARRAPLVADDIARLLDHATDSVVELRARMVERLQASFAEPELAVLFHPTALVSRAGKVGALDAAGRFVPLECPAEWAATLPALLQSPRFALFGLLRATDTLRLRCLSTVAPDLAWAGGPLYEAPEIT